MTKQSLETIVGAAVIVGAFGFLAFALQNGAGGGVPAGAYRLSARFNQASGIAPGADVRLSGVKVGAVSAIKLNTKTYQAEVDLAISSGIPVPDDSVVKVTADGLLGVPYIAIDPGASDVNLKAGQSFEYARGSVDLLTLLSTFIQSGSSPAPAPPAAGTGNTPQ